MNTNLKSMSIEELVSLRDEIEATLESKVAEERRTLESELAKLTRFSGGSRSKSLFGRGARGMVAPKYRNPENPSETWAGRGLKPRWLTAALDSGKKLDDFRITAAGKQAPPAPVAAPATKKPRDKRK
jgi:DNA-binding protein H-NS